jgi:uncharacterized protein (TIGR03085 family)
VAHPSLARRERHALCDLALELGPDAPTLCDGWDVKDLLTHLLVRERSVLAAPGIVFPPLARLTERGMARLRREECETLVRRVRARGLTPLSLPLVDELVNTLEFLVHHEDVRRAQPGWGPRELDADDLDTVWRAVRLAGKGLARPTGVPLTIRRSDTGDEAVLLAGDEPVVLSGPPVEVTFFLYGRAQHRDLDLSGPDDGVRRLREANLGL